MFDANTLMLFGATSIMLALAPGPDNIFVLTHAALKGSLVGLVVTLGLCTGLIVHTSAVAFGVAAIVRASDVAFTVLKCSGAAYLLYLAYGAFRAGALTRGAEATRDIRLAKYYLRGIVMNVTNPKVSIFFLAFLPQFVRREQGGLLLQITVLGGIFILATLLVFGTISLLAGSIGERLRGSRRVQRALNLTAGTIFAGLALKLLAAGV